jgi:hypothetical protein
MRGERAPVLKKLLPVRLSLGSLRFLARQGVGECTLEVCLESISFPTWDIFGLPQV